LLVNGTIPSVGGLYPIETYIVINRVLDYKPGIYHYSEPKHGLHLLQDGDFGASLAGAVLEVTPGVRCQPKETDNGQTEGRSQERPFVLPGIARWYLALQLSN